MSKFFPRIIFFALTFLPGVLQAQEDPIPSDSIGFYDFLKSQKEVPGLSYRFLFSETGVTPSQLSDSLFSLSKIDSGYVSVFFSDFSWIDDLKRPIMADSLAYTIQLAIYSQPTSVNSANQYLSDLIGKGDYLVKDDEEMQVEDFIALAAKTPYLPLQEYKLKFLSDYRLLAVTLIIIFFFLASSIMIVSMLVMKVTKIKREALQKEYDGIIIEPLTALLFGKELKEITEMDANEIHSFFPENLLSKELFQLVLIDRIIGLNKKMKGEFKEKLKALYKRLDLNKVSIKSLHHRKWDRVTMGLVQINEMDLVEALPEVKKFTNASNFHIRSRALSTILNLSENVDLRSLRDQAFPLSLWQQMNYLRIIRFVGLQKDLKLGILFESTNQSIRVFGIKLVRILGRVDMIETLAGFADVVSDEEKLEILDTYAALGAHMETRFINVCLKSSNLNLSMAAAKAAAVVGDVESEDILLELVETETDHRRKMEYLKSLYKLNAEKFELITLNNTSSDLMEIRNHILDPMLHHV